MGYGIILYLYDGALTLKLSKIMLNQFCDETVHLLLSKQKRVNMYHSLRSEFYSKSEIRVNLWRWTFDVIHSFWSDHKDHCRDSEWSLRSLQNELNNIKCSLQIAL